MFDGLVDLACNMAQNEGEGGVTVWVWATSSDER